MLVLIYLVSLISYRRVDKDLAKGFEFLYVPADVDGKANKTVSV